jgi:hypothetical protein
MDQISTQLEHSNEPSEIKLETKLSILKPLFCLWLYNAWIHIHKKLIQIGWEKCGLLRFQTEFQVASLNTNISSPIFTRRKSHVE